MTDDPGKSQAPASGGWLKYAVAIAAGFIGLRAATGSGTTCNMLAEQRWPGPDPGSMFIAAANCEHGPLVYFGLGAIAAFLVCGTLAEDARRPVSGAIAGLVAGGLAGAAGAFVHFHMLYGWS